MDIRCFLAGCFVHRVVVQPGNQKKVRTRGRRKGETQWQVWLARYAALRSTQVLSRAGRRLITSVIAVRAIDALAADFASRSSCDFVARTGGCPKLEGDNSTTWGSETHLKSDQTGTVSRMPEPRPQRTLLRPAPMLPNTCHEPDSGPCHRYSPTFRVSHLYKYRRPDRKIRTRDGHNLETASEGSLHSIKSPYIDGSANR